jgi:ABC-type multidrug transport system fused ATPase/permease subunit
MVLVLSHGKVQEYAPPKELTANKNSEFSKLLKELRRKKEDL